MRYNTELARDVPWAKAYAFVAHQARAVLQLIEPGTDISTVQLVERMYPEHLARGEGIAARQRIYKALAALATRNLADCCHRGLEKTKFGGLPWRWHAPCGEANPEHKPGMVLPLLKPVVEDGKCPMCGQDIW